ncbi:tryptophan synthase subunit alpha, partial [candidate division KSB1 bacterium]|nr:tryptophan synthase subunit alpha [candidate division KSB1 bacterium]
MNLEQTIRHRLTDKKIGLMTHVIAGYPSYKENFKALEIMAKYQVDLVEIQMPFSEPIADGPVFALANQEALKRGATTKKYFKFMEKVTSSYNFSVLMMGYYNPVFKMGEKIFLEQLATAGGCGFIIPDLPFDIGSSLFQDAAKWNLSPVTMMTPDTPDLRLQQLGQAGSGFIYVVARKGVTGASTQFS